MVDVKMLQSAGMGTVGGTAPPQFLTSHPSPPCPSSQFLYSVGTQTLENPFKAMRSNLLQTKAAQDRMDRCAAAQRSEVVSQAQSYPKTPLRFGSPPTESHSCFSRCQNARGPGSG